jgi:hypothetical protein
VPEGFQFPGNPLQFIVSASRYSQVATRFCQPSREAYAQTARYACNDCGPSRKIELCFGCFVHR